MRGGYKDFSKSGLTSKEYVLGRRDLGTDRGILRIGRFLALDKSLGSEIRMDALRPHVVLICGKRGYGKSYTMGMLLEELACLEPEVRKNLASLVVDTMGIFWTLRLPNKRDEGLLIKWGLAPKGLDISVFVPKYSLEKYEKLGIAVQPLSIAALELRGDDWCSLFGLDQTSPVGVLLTRKIREIQEERDSYSISQIKEKIKLDSGADRNTLRAALNFFDAAESWGIFMEEGLSIQELVQGGKTIILDLSTLKDPKIRALAVKIVGKKIYEERLEARRIYEKREMGETLDGGIPMVWLFIDEAHIFLPSEGDTPAASILVNEWLRQGRQAGLSLVLATQRPEALHPDVVSQSDVIICHRITAQDDITALEKIRPTYMREKIGESIKKMGEEKGVAVIIDDTSESAHIVRIRPRISWHGGEEPSALPKG